MCHKGDHWIAIRKVNGVWYNLNSTNIVPPGPQYISDFQLDAFLSSIKNSGFHIFSVEQGDSPLPLPSKHLYPENTLRETQMYCDAQVVYKHWQENKNRPLNFQGADEMELERALKESMKTWENENSQANGDGAEGPVGTVLNKKEDDKPKFEGQGFMLGGP